MTARDLLSPRVSAPDVPEHPAAGGALRPLGDHEGCEWRQIDQVSDATRADFAECRFVDVRADRLVLDHASLVDVMVRNAVVTQVAGRGSRWRNVRLAGGRIATLDLTEAELDSVELRDVRIDYLTLGRARVRDVQVTGCTIGTLDLPQSSVSRMRFDDSRCDEVDPRGMRAEHLDLRGLDVASFLDPASLRGASLTEAQIALHAPAFAEALGIRVDS